MQWEYAVYAVDLATVFTRGGVIDPIQLHHALNAHGKDGWELASTVETNVHDGATRTLAFIFKRPAQAAEQVDADETP